MHAFRRREMMAAAMLYAADKLACPLIFLSGAPHYDGTRRVIQEAYIPSAPAQEDDMTATS